MSIKHQLLRASGESQIACQVIDKQDPFGDGSCKAFYRLDGNANDESGNYHGTETGVPTYGGGVYERGVVSSNTNTNFITTANIPSGSARTMSVWIIPSALPTDATFHTVYSGIVGGTGTIAFYLRYISVGVYSIDTYHMLGSVRRYPTSAPTVALSVGQKIHVVTMLNSDNTTMTIYVNGTAIGTNIATTTNGVSTTYSGALMLGQYNPNGSYNAYTFKGTIDQLRAFNRPLTATEVGVLYAECAPTSIVDDINPFMDGSLKAMYKFDGDTNDLTGVYNLTSAVTYATGKFGDCAVLDNTQNTYLTSNTLQNSFSVNNLSYSFWFKSTLTSSTGTQALIDMSSTTAGTNLFYLRLVGSVIKLYLGTSTEVASPTTLVANTWYHVTGSYLNGVSKVYLNGTLNFSSTTPHGMSSFIYVDIACLRSRYPTLTGYSLNGSIDQFRIFNKALTPLEVASLYNETTPLEEPMSTLVDPFRDFSGSALYRFDGNALDESGNYNGTPTNITYGTGKFGRCAVFNGSSSYVTASPVVGSSTFTYSLWVNASTVTLAGKNMIDFTTGRANFSNGATTSGLEYYDGGAWRVLGYTLTANVLTHLVLVVSGKSAKLYVNGTLISKTTVTVTIPRGIARIGSNYLGSGSFFAGSIDQVRIFNRALTAGEVATLYTEI